MIYHPKTKTKPIAIAPSGAGGFAISIDADMVSQLEGVTSDPLAFAERIASIRPSWVKSLSSGVRTIKYTRPPDDISRQIMKISSQIAEHIKAQQAAYRTKKNKAMKLIRESCEIDVPVFKYVRQWRVRDITYVKKVKLRVADATHYENSGAEIRFDTSDYDELLSLSEKVGAFDKTRTVRIVISKTIGYWANVKTFVRNRKVIKDRGEYDKRRANWVNQNPPYRAGKDPQLAALRQQVVNLKLKAATEYNQCLAVCTGGSCGSPSECWDAAYAMLCQYLVPIGILAKGPYVHTSDLGISQNGFCVRVERLAPGSETEAPNWYDVYNFKEDWEKPELENTISAPQTNRELGQKICPYANSALELIGERDFAVERLGLGAFLRSAYDRAALNLAAGGRNPFEWNFVRSFAELKDTHQTVKTARSFLQQIFAGKFRAVTTLGQAASLYLTYKYGVAPTADELGTLLGTSKSLLKHTYPMLRTLNAYATGAATATLTGRQAVSFDIQSIVEGLFPSRWEQDLHLGDIDIHSEYRSSWGHTYSLSNYGFYDPRGPQTGGNTSIPPSVWRQLEASGVAPRWVWLPESPLVFCKYDAKKVRESLGTSFVEIIDSLDILTTGWELTPLSFVVDWFTNLRSAIQAMDHFIRANWLELSPDGEGPWHSTRFRLCLATPIYRKRGVDRSFVTWYDSLKTWQVETTGHFGYQYRGTYVRPQGAHVRIVAPRVGVNLIATDAFAYARDLLEGAPLLALLPDLKVSLNAGKLSGLLAMLLSGDR